MKKQLRLIISLALLAFCATGANAEEYVWDFSVASYASASEDQVAWTSDYAKLVVDKAEAGTPANNYLGGGNNNGNTITSSRFYKNSVVTITPADGYTVTSVVFECTTENYAKALKESTWDNATATISEKVVTITPTDGTKPFSATMGGTTGSSKVTLNYVAPGGVIPPTPPVISPATGTYTEPQTVTITADEGLKILYSLDNVTYNYYYGPFKVSETTTVYACSEDANGNKSSHVESTITIKTGTEEPVIYSAEFKNNKGGFEFSDVTLPEGLSYVWTNNNYGWVASGYKDKAYEAESWLISPAFKIDAGSPATLSFSHALNKGTKEACGLYVSEDKQNWTEINVPNWPEGTNWTFISSGDIDLSTYAGKTIYLGFKYASTTSNAPTWEIQELTLKGKGSSDVNPAEVPEYTTIAAAKAAATADHVDVVMKLTNVTVTYVNGSSNYITDGTDGFLLFGSSLGLKTGDNIDITVPGQLYLYHKLPELAVSKVDEVKVNSSDNVVDPVVVEVTDLLTDYLKYSSMLVKIEGTGIEEEAWTERLVTLIQDGEECKMYDNWKVATEMTFKTDKDYNITGIAAVRDENVQIYPRTSTDIELITEQALPTSKWMDGEEEVENIELSSLDEALEAKFVTDSDGEVTYESSDESVATVDAAGKITLVGPGKCVITAKTAETSAFQASSAQLNIKVMILQGDGTKENPYTIADVKLLYDENQPSEPVWITGYIVGCVNGTMAKPAWTSDSENVVATNFIISDDAETEDVADCIPMELAKGELRDNYNLKDHPENFGQQMKAYGVITKYFSISGFKNVTEIIIGEEQEEAKKGDVNEDDKVDISDIVAVINQIAGTASYKNADVNGDSKVDISDIVAIINIIAGQ
jgi:hypothetical protein